jgi:hypothetical protein
MELESVFEKPDVLGFPQVIIVSLEIDVPSGVSKIS